VEWLKTCGVSWWDRGWVLLTQSDAVITTNSDAEAVTNGCRTDNRVSCIAIAANVEVAPIDRAKARQMLCLAYLA